MNYRQWKKNYKKIHGCNPTFEVDKRKQVKSIRKCIVRLYEPGNHHWSIICRRRVVLRETAEKFPLNFRQRRKVYKGLK